MIDKVQKIREEVERMHNLLPVMDGNNISINYADRICTTLEMYIDSLQEEPVSSIWHSMDETPEYPCDILFLRNVGSMFLYRYMKNGRPIDHETPYFRDITNGKCWCYCKDIVNMKKEPVSGDLEEAIEDAMPDANWYIEENNDTTGEDAYNSIQMGNMFKAGAKWKKEQMLKEAIETTVEKDTGGYPYIFIGKPIELYDYDKDISLAKPGDIVKIVIIKEKNKI